MKPLLDALQGRPIGDLETFYCSMATALRVALLMAFCRRSSKITGAFCMYLKGDNY